ncbi:ubiquitin carboxyl-terminal hydrolase 37-like [Hippoglossus hippoglossus]|uniref:ubiquitin carboxyl-terminal hydrolase 37-like n=1 Tax=Hippoglossus hippoglossus TaxID=8267 RepID=UPI00148B5E18|nr:ubiquitin carboxyl-terminal hydrolase 37-like [Hippoglossus hippoglossus]
MNSSLQSLLTLMEFIRDISCQEDAWKMVPEATVLMAFMSIVRCHRSPNEQNKLDALFTFKMEVAERFPEFSDMGQKDAHEFLTSFLEHIERLNPVMTELSNKTEKVYKCPVQVHLSFKMQNTRTCRRCGHSSRTEEMFNNLSLNLVPQESVQDMLENYLLETDTQQYSFKTLPRVLILHVKRFCYTLSMTLKKLHNKVNISRELLVSSTQANGWYSLVSFISHLGCNANSGHYVSAGVQREAVEDDVTDSWAMYDDNYVTNVAGTSVCSQVPDQANGSPPPAPPAPQR